MGESFESQVFDGLVNNFTIDDLRTLCQRLGVNPERVASSEATRDELARKLIQHMGNRGRYGELITQLRAERPHVGWPDAPTGETDDGRAPSVPLQRPPAATHFTGRAPELEALKAALQPGRVVTLYGPGGIGKTALAAEALRDLAPGDDPPARFPGGVFFHSFYGRPPVADCAAEIARAWGIDPRPDPFAAMSAALRGRAALLILDGAEEADQLDELLARRDRCGVLITSRRREDVKDVGIEVERLPLDKALELLWVMAHPAPSLPDPLPEGEGTDRPSPWEQLGEGEAARAICELVGNLPLALRLAGRYLFQSGQTVAEYQAWLRATPLAALDFGRRRQESAAILLDKSVAQLNDAGRAALGVAGCLSIAPFDAGPAVAALGPTPKIKKLDVVRQIVARLRGDSNSPIFNEREVFSALGELVNYELLRRAGDRYETTHALVHGYARERLSVEPPALRRLGAYYDTLARTEREKGLPGYRRLDPERPHILAVLPRLAATGEWAAANRLVWAVHSWLDVQGYPRDRIAALEVGLAAARALDRKYDQAAHLNHLGLAYAALGQPARAIEMHEAALVIAREIGDRRGEGARLGSLGLAYAALGQTARAIEQYEAALAIAREIGDRRGEGVRLNNLGFAFLAIDEVDKALNHCKQALTISREVGDRSNEAHTLDSLGSIYRKMGDIEQAKEKYLSALAIFDEIQSPQAEDTRASLAALED